MASTEALSPSLVLFEPIRRERSQRDPEGAEGASATSDAYPEGGASSFPCPKDITSSPFNVCVYEGVGEASISFRGESSSLRGAEGSSSDLALLRAATDEWGEINIPLLLKLEDERRQQNIARSNRRRVRRVRQYCVKNTLTLMWTLTYAEAQWDRKKIKADVNQLMIAWRGLNGGREFPYVYVLELHPKGHGYHVHLAVPEGMWTSHAKLKRLWGKGRIQFDEQKKRRSGEDRNNARRLAGYLSKYLVKAFDSDGLEVEKGDHFYEVAQGFGVEVLRRSFPTFAEAESFLLSMIEGEQFAQVWTSLDCEWWPRESPPVWVFESP